MLNLFTPKQLKCGFIILCPDHNVGHLRITARSLQSRYQGVPYTCVVGNTATAADMKELKAVCPTYKGKDTFSSLVNVGFKYAPADWNFVVMAGTTVRGNLDLKMSMFIESEKDILFPVADKKWDFHEGTMNGLLIHKKTFKEVGDWDANLPLETCKLFWASDAIDKGCKFKAIIGTKLC